MAETLLELFTSSAAPALLAPGRPALDHAGLLAQVERGVRALRRAGIRPGDRIAMVLDNGPHTATAFLAAASAASAGTGCTSSSTRLRSSTSSIS